MSGTSDQNVVAKNIFYHIWPLLTFDPYEGIIIIINIIISDLLTKFGSHGASFTIFDLLAFDLYEGQ